MKKAPKKYRKGYEVGGVTDGDPKKKKPFTSTTPTIAAAMAAKGLINPSTAKALESERHAIGMTDDYTRKYTPPIEKAGEPKDSGRTFRGTDANGNTTYTDNATGETYTLDKEGKRYAKGGTVMKKAPCKMKKGGTC